jgi:hypothetical protein
VCLVAAFQLLCIVVLVPHAHQHCAGTWVTIVPLIDLTTCIAGVALLMQQASVAAAGFHTLVETPGGTFSALNL